MGNILVLGGFTESRRLLEPVAEEAVAQGFGDDADVLTLRAAAHMDVERLRGRMAGKTVISHSAALLPVPDARQSLAAGELPEDFVIIAGPEPRPVSKLAGSAIRKTREHFTGETPHARAAHRRVAASGAVDLMAHLPSNLSLVPDISRFSTLEQIRTGRIAASQRLGSFAMWYDEFYGDPQWLYKPVQQELRGQGVVVAELLGGHDELLVDPAGVLRAAEAELRGSQVEAA